MDLNQEAMGPAQGAAWPLTPERAIELKAKARALFVQGLEYSSLREDNVATQRRAKPVWE